jgi:holo-[acyl-carrier protein] synthase
MIVGLGTDIVLVERITALVAAHGERFLNRCFTPAEQTYCARSNKRRVEHLAGRFAAKEAILKVLGTGLRQGIAWTDIEVLPDALGKPVVILCGQAADIATSRNITAWHISISHITTHATATAIGEAK